MGRVLAHCDCSNIFVVLAVLCLLLSGFAQRHTLEFNTHDLTSSFVWRQRCYWLKVMLCLWVFPSISAEQLSQTLLSSIACVSLWSVPVFQDSGIPDSFPVYHYNGLKQSNHKERVRCSFMLSFFIITYDSGSFLRSLSLNYLFFSCHQSYTYTHTRTAGSGRPLQNKQ